MKSTIHSPVFIRDIRPTVVEYKDTFHNSSQDGEMMNLFNALPSELFSILASPNRLLYADALDVLGSRHLAALGTTEIGVDTLGLFNAGIDSKAFVFC